MTIHGRHLKAQWSALQPSLNFLLLNFRDVIAERVTMVIPIGVGVGDFIAVTRLISTIISELKEVTDSREMARFSLNIGRVVKQLQSTKISLSSLRLSTACSPNSTQSDPPSMYSITSTQSGPWPRPVRDNSRVSFTRSQNSRGLWELGMLKINGTKELVAGYSGM